MSEPLWSIATPMGDLVVTGRASQISICSAEFQPDLPEGMGVAACHAVMLRLSEARPESTISFVVHLEGSNSVFGGPETGEGLEALVWRDSGCVLAVGTEDDDFIRLRTGVYAPAAVFDYSNSALSVIIQPHASCPALTLHLILAWNPAPEPSPESCWYAVDQRHERIAALFAA